MVEFATWQDNVEFKFPSANFKNEKLTKVSFEESVHWILEISFQIEKYSKHLKMHMIWSDLGLSAHIYTKINFNIQLKKLKLN